MRLAKKPWIPFTKEDGPTFIAEKLLFDEMSKNYNREAALSSQTGYKNFTKAWITEADKRYL